MHSCALCLNNNIACRFVVRACCAKIFSTVVHGFRLLFFFSTTPSRNATLISVLPFLPFFCFLGASPEYMYVCMCVCVSMSLSGEDTVWLALWFAHLTLATTTDIRSCGRCVLSRTVKPTTTTTTATMVGEGERLECGRRREGGCGTIIYPVSSSNRNGMGVRRWHCLVFNDETQIRWQNRFEPDRQGKGGGTRYLVSVLFLACGLNAINR